MKTSLIFFLFIFSHTMFGQTVYTSHTTQHFPSAELEAIDRVITVDKDRITIKSIVGDDVKIQTLKIMGKVTNYNDKEVYEVFECLSRNGRETTTVMIKKNKPGYITLHQPSLTDPNSFKEYKLLLD